MVNPVGLVKWVTFNSYAALIHTFLRLTTKNKPPTTMYGRDRV